MSPALPPKRLYRSKKDRMLAGVCSGIGDYFNIDPTFVRIVFVGLMLAFLSTLVIYLIMWVIVPAEPEQATANHDNQIPKP